MLITEAQREVRTVFLGGFVGQAVSSALWLLSAAAATWGSPRRGIVILAFGGALIFPGTQAGLRLMGRRASLSVGNPLGQLAMQVAFTVPLNLLVVAGATLYRLNWFYPACMIVVGTHYLPFVFLYGMWQFWILGGLLVAGGVVIGLYSASFGLGGWVTGVILLVFAFVGRSVARTEEMSVAVVNGRNSKGRVSALLLAVLLLVSATARAADLRITDSRGTEVVVQSAAIDYGGFMASELETQGIRLMQGDGTVMVKWADLESLKVTRRDDSVKPPRIELEVVLKSQKKLPAALLRQGRMKLTGKTELGEYSIDLDKVRTITPIK
jgi:hypothetical protein